MYMNRRAYTGLVQMGWAIYPPSPPPHARHGGMVEAYLFLKIWRQNNNKSKGKIVKYEINDISPDMSFLEMLDVLNEKLIHEGNDPVSFDHDCREGICGSCSLFINGRPHGPERGITTCQLHMRKFKDVILLQ